MMGIGGGELNLPGMLLDQESQRIVNDGRQQDQKKQQMQMDQMQKTQQTVQQILAQQAAGRQPVTAEETTKLMAMSSKQKEELELKEWQSQADTNMKIAEALAPTDRLTADEYRKEANYYRNLGTARAKQNAADQKEKVKETSGILYSAWHSPEAAASALAPGGALDQVNPEMADMLRKKYTGRQFDKGMAEDIKNMAMQGMTADQQMNRETQIQKVISDTEAKQERLSIDRERLATQQQAVIDKREKVAADRAEKQTKEQKALATYSKAEINAQKIFDSEYKTFHGDFTKARAALIKAGGSPGQAPTTDEQKAHYEDMKEAVQQEWAVHKAYADNINLARLSAQEQGVTTGRVIEEFKPPTVSDSKINAVHTSNVSQKPSEVMAALRTANPKMSDEEILKNAQEEGLIAKDYGGALDKERERLRKLREKPENKGLTIAQIRSKLGEL